MILAENGTEGLAKVEENPDLIIVDLTMADGDAYEFLKRLRAVPGRATTPVIVSSGQLAGDVAIVGADRFLAKPFRANELNALVDELVSSRIANERELKNLADQSFRRRHRRPSSKIWVNW